MIMMMMRMLPMKLLDRMTKVPRKPMPFIRVNLTPGRFTFASAELRTLQIRMFFIIDIRTLAIATAKPRMRTRFLVNILLRSVNPSFAFCHFQSHFFLEKGGIAAHCARLRR
jgi:hypothetical protein